MITLIKAPSILGLRPTGVEYLPEALLQAGLAEKLHITDIRTVNPPKFSDKRDNETHMLNPNAIAEYSVNLANTVEQVLQTKSFPLVLGGDCSILLGNALALKRQGRYGLFFLDGHSDFYQPEASETGEAADMDLALVTGRGPDVVTNIENQKPFIRDEDTVQFGQRDRQETIEFGAQQIAESGIHVFELATIRQNGLKESCKKAIDILVNQPIEGIWVHIDADVLRDDEMSAVEYHLPGGLRFEELQTVLHMLLVSNKIIGLDLTVFNPTLDPTGKMAAKLTSLLSETLSKYK